MPNLTHPTDTRRATCDDCGYSGTLAALEVHSCYVQEQGGRCEDYPCCGHTDDNPCERQWYDEPDAFDTTKNPHALCDHENGECDVDYYEDEEYEDD